ncbi:MAG: hypothetical protein ABJE95_03050 [Byssovorax sp.]
MLVSSVPVLVPVPEPPDPSVNWSSPRSAAHPDITSTASTNAIHITFDFIHPAYPNNPPVEHIVDTQPRAAQEAPEEQQHREITAEEDGDGGPTIRVDLASTPRFRDLGRSWPNFGRSLPEWSPIIARFWPIILRFWPMLADDVADHRPILADASRRRGRSLSDFGQCVPDIGRYSPPLLIRHQSPPVSVDSPHVVQIADGHLGLR